MIRQEYNRIDPKRKSTINHKKKQFENPTFKHQEYRHRLNLYETPPTAEIRLEEFEQWAIDRLRILAEIESCSFRNRTPAETVSHLTPLLKKYLPLSPNSSAPSAVSWRDPTLQEERRKDHYSHFILRLAFSSTEDLRRRFARVESALFKLRFQSDDARERKDFVESLDLNWEPVSEEERRLLASKLRDATPGIKQQEVDEGGWFKVDFENVPELVEHRRVFLKAGKAYVPAREQMSMVLAGFSERLDKGLEQTARALPRLDEDDRLTPILTHLSKSFATPDSHLSDTDSSLPSGCAPITASSIDALSTHFPLCMRNLHLTLRRDSHLKHFGRLQYTLFLKGIGLSLDECIHFWRTAFTKKTDDEFNKEYKYNVRHSYGDVGGDATRRGRGYTPFSCQKILTEHQPGNQADAHGCPYRHFSPENLETLLRRTGVNDMGTLKGVKEDVERKRYHIACNRVFEHVHKGEIKKGKEEGRMSAADLDTIVHPNTWFKRSWMLKVGGGEGMGMGKGVKGEEMEM